MTRDNVQALRNFERALNNHVALAPVLRRSVYPGADAVCDLLLEEIPSVIDEFRAETRQVREGGTDTVIVEVRLAGQGRVSGTPIEQVFFQVYRFREGRAISLHSYVDREQALDAVAQQR